MLALPHQLCQELGLPSEKYAVVLRKLERQQEAMEADAEGPRGYRGAATDADFGIEAPLPERAAEDVPGFEAAEPEVAQKPRKRLQKGRTKEVDDDDLDWGDTELGDDLLPG